MRLDGSIRLQTSRSLGKPSRMKTPPVQVTEGASEDWSTSRARTGGSTRCGLIGHSSPHVGKRPRARETATTYALATGAQRTRAVHRGPGVRGFRNREAPDTTKPAADDLGRPAAQRNGASSLEVTAVCGRWSPWMLDQASTPKSTPIKMRP